MAEVGFQPNTLARGLRGGRTGIVGVCFQELDSPILARKVALLQQSLRELGYHALIELTNVDRDLERAALRNFMSMQAEGIVLIGSQLSPDDETLTACQRQGKPLIWVDPESKVNGEELSIDRPYSMRLVLDHLHGLGHRNFAVMGIDPGNPYGAFRWPAFEKHCRRLEISIGDSSRQYFVPGRERHDYEYGRDLAEMMLADAKPMPTAIIALNDRVAIGAMNRLREAGIETPRDVSVVGYDNLEVGGHIQPALTTIDQCAEKLMTQAAKKMVELLDAGTTDAKQSRRLIKPKLIVRESTATPPKS